MRSNNLPDDVSLNDPRAPWNQPDPRYCADCKWWAFLGADRGFCYRKYERFAVDFERSLAGIADPRRSLKRADAYYEEINDLIESGAREGEMCWEVYGG